MNKYGINTHVPNAEDITQCVELGVPWIRCDFNWFQIETEKDIYNWSFIDEVVNMAQSNCLNILATLAYTPPWAGNGKTTSIPNDINDWGNFATAAAERYNNRITHWEIWNEPNLDTFFDGDADDYSDLLKIASTQIKLINSNNKVCGPALSHQGNMGDKKFWYSWIKKIAKHSQYLDILTHHIYKDPNWYHLWRKLDGLTIPFYEGENLSCVKKRYFSNTDFWITETGYRTDKTNGESLQSSNYEKCMKGLNSRSWIKNVLVYELKDDPNAPNMWGLFRPDGTPKPAVETFKKYSKN